MNLCISSGFFTPHMEDSLEGFRKSVKIAKEAGFASFDYGISSRYFEKENWRTDAASVKKTVEEEGMVLKYAHLPFNYPAEGDTEGWKRFQENSFRAIDLAVELGVDSAAIHPYTLMRKDYDKETAFENACTFLAPYVDYAKKAGLLLGLENMRGAGISAPQIIRRFCTDIDDLIHVADTVGTGICFDTGHANISMQEQKKSLLKVGKRLTHIHVDDNFAEDDVHTIPFIGTVDWQSFIDGLKAIGYQGDFNLELNVPAKVPDSVCLPYVSLMAAAGKSLISMFEA